MTKLALTDEDLRKRLTPEQYRVLREKGTEIPFSGKYVSKTAAGMYTCAACGAQLFTSDDQYEAHMLGLAGWPSFARAIDDESVELKDDNSHDMKRTEVVCANCGSHLGHLFDGDSDSPTGKHYCINSAALKLNSEEAK